MVIKDILAAASAGAPQARDAFDLRSGKTCTSTKHGAISEGMVWAAGR
jgi:hypothetical protein